MNKEDYKKIIENYSHDFRDTEMNQDELQKMLNDCFDEILSQPRKKDLGTPECWCGQPWVRKEEILHTLKGCLWVNGDIFLGDRNHGERPPLTDYEKLKDSQEKRIGIVDDKEYRDIIFSGNSDNWDVYSYKPRDFEKMHRIVREILDSDANQADRVTKILLDLLYLMKR